MQLACQRFSCQKAVEVCYWTCKFRRNCKDWQKGLTGEPGLVLIQTRLEAAAAKSGRVFDLETLSSPVRIRKVKAQPPALTKANSHEAVAARVSVVSRSALTAQSNFGTRSDVAMLSRAQTAAPNTTEAIQQLQPGIPKTSKKKNAGSPAAQVKKTMSETELETNSEKAPTAKPKAVKAKPVRPKPVTTGPIYVLLSPNGKYKELREADLLTEAATLLKDPTLRLIKGHQLVPTISFKEAASETE